MDEKRTKQLGEIVDRHREILRQRDTEEAEEAQRMKKERAQQEREKGEVLAKLLARCTPENAHEEIGWGTPYATTTDLIRQWAVDRNLHTADPNKQALKLGEEFGELFEGLAKGNEDLTKDAIGDMYVVLTILSEQLGFTIEECIDIAYDEIKNRKGRMIDGVFVKESDL